MFLVCHRRQRELPKMQPVIAALQAEFARMRGDAGSAALLARNIARRYPTGLAPSI